MSKIPFDRKRNIGIVAHIDAGKTTTTERILYYTRITKKIGEVHSGQATMDFMKQEREKGITIGSAATTVPWNYQGLEYQYNIIDTPGHVDFTIEVERSLKVLDGAFCVIDAANGVEAQTSTVWKQANRYKVPRILFINKIDKSTADFQHSIDSISKQLSHRLFIVQIPVSSIGTLGNGNDFLGIIDIIKGKLLKWSGVVGDPYTEHEIPQTHMSIYKKYKDLLLSALVECASDDLQIQLIEDAENITSEELEREIRRQSLNIDGFAVYVGSAYKNIGIEPLLDGATKYLPNPQEKNTYLLDIKTGKPSDIILPCDEKGPFVALVFKIVKDEFAGKLTYLRIYSGTMQKGEDYRIARTGKTIRFASVFKMHAAERTRIDISEAIAGEIVVITGQSDMITGDTVTSNLNMTLEPILLPEKVLSMSIRPAEEMESAKIIAGLFELSVEDPSFGFEFNEKTKQIVVFGMGELHIEIKLEHLEERLGVKFIPGEHKIQYKESFSGSPLTVDYKHQKQTGGKGQYAHIVIKMVPLSDSNAPVEFESQIVGMNINKEFFKAIEDGIRETCQAGVLTKSPVTGIKIILLDGSQHSVDSDQLSFKICGKYAMTEMLKKAYASGQLILLEPIARVEFINIGESHFGNVTILIGNKGGQISETIKDGDVSTIVAFIPLKNTLDIITELRSRTRGQVSFVKSFKQFEPITDRSRIAKISAESGGIMKDEVA